MPNDNTDKVLALISGSLTLFNKQLEKQNKALADLADSVKNQKITVSAPDVKVNLSEMKIARLDIPPINIPEIKVPKAEVSVKIPKIEVPRPQVTVNVPEQPRPIVNVPAPIVNVPDFPTEMSVSGFSAFVKAVLGFFKDFKAYSIRDEVDELNPIPVVLVDPKGNPYKAEGGGAVVSVGGGQGFSAAQSNRMTVMKSGSLASTTPGAPVKFSASNLPIAQVIVTAYLGNADVVVVGDSGIIAAANTRQGVPLVQGQAAMFNIDDLSKLYLDVVQSGDKVSYTYLA